MAFDCGDPAHEEAHITAETADVLVEKVLSHFATYHPDVTEEQVRESVAAAAYAERPESDDTSVGAPHVG